jgi:hypothetical protein
VHAWPACPAVRWFVVLPSLLYLPSSSPSSPQQVIPVCAPRAIATSRERQARTRVPTHLLTKAPPLQIFLTGVARGLWVSPRGALFILSLVVLGLAFTSRVQPSLVGAHARSSSLLTQGGRSTAQVGMKGGGGRVMAVRAVSRHGGRGGGRGGGREGRREGGQAGWRTMSAFAGGWGRQGGKSLMPLYGPRGKPLAAGTGFSFPSPYVRCPLWAFPSQGKSSLAYEGGEGGWRDADTPIIRNSRLSTALHSASSTSTSTSTSPPPSETAFPPAPPRPSEPSIPVSSSPSPSLRRDGEGVEDSYAWVGYGGSAPVKPVGGPAQGELRWGRIVGGKRRGRGE